jgi:hypothetical protein
MLMLAQALAGAADAATYANARFGYWIDYPADLVMPGRESDNGDGREFHAQRGTAKMAAWGGYNALDQSPAQIARDYEKDCRGGKIAYQVAKLGLAAFSCTTPRGRVIYQKTLIGGDVLATVRFDYPVAERATWDRVVNRVASSLRLRPVAP